MAMMGRSHIAWLVLAYQTLFAVVVLQEHQTEAHFLFTKLDDKKQEVQVTFSEPVALMGEGISFLEGRVTQLFLVQFDTSSPNGDDTAKYSAVELTNRGGYLGSSLPTEVKSNLLNTPMLLTGFLDFGDFGDLGDLQYTFSTQTFSTNPANDWKNFFHRISTLDAYSIYEETNPFAITFRNYGPPYEVVLTGVSETTPVRVCLFQDSTNREIGCTEGTTENIGHILFDFDELLFPCETYFVLANTTTINEDGKRKSLWSSTSVIWNEPCPIGEFTNKATAATSETTSSSNSTPLLIGAASIFSFFIGLFLSKMRNQRRYEFHSKISPNAVENSSELI